MKTDKEYPATHSMSTAWYFVDDDDNVAIMEFEDEGPIPVGVPRNGYFNENVLFGEVLEEDERDGTIQLTKEQLDLLLGEPHSPLEEECWYDVVVQIDTTREKEFFEWISKGTIEFRTTVSKELGLYRIEPDDDFQKGGEGFIPGSPMDMLISSGIIKAVFQIPDWDTEYGFRVTLPNGEWGNDFKRVPYYIYNQPIWTQDVQTRAFIPEFPVKLHQVDASKREKLLRIPGRFDEMKYVQVAQWYPSFLHTQTGDVRIEHQYYSLLPMVGGPSRYVLNNFWCFDFLPYCPLKEEVGCEECGQFRCASTYSKVDVLKPTILYIVNPRTNGIGWYGLHKLSFLREKILAFSYLPMYPQVEKTGFTFEVRKQMLDETLRDVFEKSHGWLESVVEEVRPRVLIIDDEAREIFESVFPIKDQSVEIGKEAYPIFLLSELASCRGHIEELAAMPYRGRVFQHSYSIEEMEELKKKGVAQ